MLYVVVCCFFRRILSRPWHADEHVREVVSNTATGRQSPAQILQHSSDLRAEFKRICREHRPLLTEQTNLRAAKHRFEMFQKPLGRTIRLFDCIHKFAVWLVNNRNDDRGRRAKRWLAWVAATPRRVLLAAMLADAADEASAMIRFCDTEQLDAARVSRHVVDFLGRVNALFGARALCRTEVGYTNIILKFLREPFVWVLRGKIYSLSSPTEEDVAFCLDHMRAWLKLAKAEVRAEFPDFEVAQAFRIFDSASGASWRSNTELPKHVACLAKACDVDGVALKQQFATFEDFAHREIRATGCDNKEAWRRAVIQMGARRAATRRLYPDKAIRVVLQRWFAFCASTSGVEQGFTKGQIAFTDRQERASSNLESAYIKLAIDAKRDDPMEICKAAQRGQFVSAFRAVAPRQGSIVGKSGSNPTPPRTQRQHFFARGGPAVQMWHPSRLWRKSRLTSMQSKWAVGASNMNARCSSCRRSAATA